MDALFRNVEKFSKKRYIWYTLYPEPLYPVCVNYGMGVFVEGTPLQLNVVCSWPKRTLPMRTFGRTYLSVRWTLKKSLLSSALLTKAATNKTGRLKQCKSLLRTFFVNKKTSKMYSKHSKGAFRARITLQKIGFIVLGHVGAFFEHRPT